MKTFTLQRLRLGPAWTPGTLECPREDGTTLILATLELPWRNNAPGLSCIPAGKYQVVYAWSDRWNRFMPWLLDVPFREAIEFHVGNVPADTDGCILVGSEATAIGIGRSQRAFALFDAWLSRAAQRGVLLTVVNPPAAAAEAA